VKLWKRLTWEMRSGDGDELQRRWALAEAK
jgi:hypothetical protein